MSVHVDATCPPGAYHVASAGNGGDDTRVEVDEIGDLAGSEVDLDCVIDLHSRVRVADPSQSFSIKSQDIGRDRSGAWRQ